MAPTGLSRVPHPPAEQTNAMFDSTVDMEDVFRDDDINMDAPIEQPAAQPTTKDGDDTLGLEEEVKVTRKRQPVAKLDEDRLDSYKWSLDCRTHPPSGFCRKLGFQSYDGLLRNGFISKEKVTRLVTAILFSFWH